MHVLKDSFPGSRSTWRLEQSRGICIFNAHPRGPTGGSRDHPLRNTAISEGGGGFYFQSLVTFLCLPALFSSPRRTSSHH